VRYPLSPLWSASSANTDVLPDSTSADFAFDYVDIGSVITGQVAADLQTITFGESPSRARRLAEPGDVIVSTVRTYLKAIAPIESYERPRVYSTGFAVLRPNPAIMRSDFFKYGLLSEDFIDQITAHSVGVSYPAINTSDLMRFAIPTPSLDVQRCIAEYLDRETAEIDAMDAELDRLVETLRERIRVLSTSAVFGISDSGSTSVDALVAGIPGHWSTTKFGLEFVESTERNGDSLLGPLLSISEYRGVELNERTDGQQASEDVSKYRVVRPGQLAANMMWLNHGGLGVSSLTGYISPDYKAFWISDRFEPSYAHYLFRSSRYVDYFDAIGTGVRPNAKRVTKTALGMTPVPLPPLAEQRRIVAELDEQTGRIDDMIADAQGLKALLAERRSTLITEVVTGKKEVPA
jgi:type I restriction enzyme S subunit